MNQQQQAPRKKSRKKKCSYGTGIREHRISSKGHSMNVGRPNM
jgi:hypothetical protein